MAAKKQSAGEREDSLGELLAMDPKGTAEQFAQMAELIGWVSRTIVIRNANGKLSDKFCALCNRSRLHKEPCRHTDIWRLTK